MLEPREKKLIAELRRNGRENITSLAKKHDVPKSTFYDMLHRLEEKGIISHKSTVNFEKIGYPIQILIMAKSTPEHKERLKNFLMQSQNVNNAYTVNKGSDFCLEAVFKNPKEAEAFIEELETCDMLTQISSYNIIEEICKEKFLTEEEHFE